MNPLGKEVAADAVLARLESAMEAHEQPPTCVADVMTRDVMTCSPTDTVEHCARIMWDRACGCVPVIDDERRPIAMITDRDVCMAAYTQGKALNEIGVSSAMSGRIFTVREDVRLDDAERLMRTHGVRRLPVVNREGALVGVLSIADIAAHAHLGPTLRRDGLSANAVAATVAALHHAQSVG